MLAFYTFFNDLYVLKWFGQWSNLCKQVHSTVSYYSHSYNYLVVAVVVAEAKK